MQELRYRHSTGNQIAPLSISAPRQSCSRVDTAVDRQTAFRADISTPVNGHVACHTDLFVASVVLSFLDFVRRVPCLSRASMLCLSVVVYRVGLIKLHAGVSDELRVSAAHSITREFNAFNCQNQAGVSPVCGKIIKTQANKANTGCTAKTAAEQALKRRAMVHPKFDR